MTTESTEWLTANIDIWERQKADNHKHLNNREVDAISRIAKEINPLIKFDEQPGCRECIQAKITFVFTEYEKGETLVRFATFPKHDKPEKKTK
jgi:hypothetical protein